MLSSNMFPGQNSHLAAAKARAKGNERAKPAAAAGRRLPVA